MARRITTTLQGFTVSGRFPEAVAGRLLGIHGDTVHSVQVRGREWSYRGHRIETEGSSDGAARELIVFGGAILAFGPGSLARRLSPTLDSLTPVDVAGQSRPLAASPRRDRITGDLHLLANGPDGSQAHVVVSSGAFTRRNRPLIDPPNRIRDLAVGEDHVLFASDGFLGIGARDPEIGVQWIATGVEAPVLVHAHSIGDTVVVIAVTPSLERWEIRLASPAVHRQVLDPTPQRFARTNHHAHDAAQQLLWTIGDRTAGTYELTTGRRVRLDAGRRRPGDLVFVADPARAGDDGGWLVGLLHDVRRRDAELVVLDAADISRPAVATARIPRPVPMGLHTAWIPDPADSQAKETDDAPHP